jgi:leader peptidase (prepilin peptidase)/N-methyltransferase
VRYHERVLAELPYWFWAGVAISLGLTLGSFLNVVIHRLPRGESVAYPASRCPACGAPIRPYDNVPVLSFLILRGKARCCKAPISPRYPLTELLGGLCGWAALAKVLVDAPSDVPLWTCALLFLSYLALGLGLIAAIFIDLEFMLLPDEITLGGAALGFLTTGLRHTGWVTSLTGAAVGFALVYLPFILLYRVVRGHPGMGLGDAKLLVLAGAWFGWKGALFALLVGAVQGTVVALVVLLVKGRLEEPVAVQEERALMLKELATLEGEEREEHLREMAADPLAADAGEGIGKARIPFGPFLAIAIIEYLFFGEPLLDAYLSVLGS